MNILFNKRLFVFALSLVSFNVVSADDAWMRSYTLETAGQYVAAAESIEHLLKVIPANEFAELRSGWLYYLAGNYSRSIKHYQTAIKLNNKSIDAMLGMSLPDRCGDQGKNRPEQTGYQDFM